MKTGFENGNVVGVTDFDYEELDRGNPLVAVMEADEAPAWEYLLHDSRARLALEKLRRVVLTIAGAKNSKMSAECFLTAVGDTSDEDQVKGRITRTARRHGVGKAAASKCCVDWCEYLGKKPSAFMRSEASKISFQQSNITRKKNAK